MSVERFQIYIDLAISNKTQMMDSSPYDVELIPIGPPCDEHFEFMPMPTTAQHVKACNIRKKHPEYKEISIKQLVYSKCFAEFNASGIRGGRINAPKRSRKDK